MRVVEIPSAVLQRPPDGWEDPEDLENADWTGALRLSPLVRADGLGEPSVGTVVRLYATDRALYVRFDCEDDDIWGTYENRDDPLHQEEVVEVFLAPGQDPPAAYAEFEVSPLGTLFDAWVFHPTGRREDRLVSVDWNCPGIRWCARSDRGSRSWWAALAIPWASLARNDTDPPAWRANFYRIERPRQGVPEYSAWSPTLAIPADFHVPRRFGRLLRPGAASQEL